MAIADINTESQKDTDSIIASQKSRSASLIKLLSEWMADESGYDEENWPRIKKMLEENRTSDRPIFNE